MSRDTVKRCLHALKMGASTVRRPKNAIYGYIIDGAGEAADEAHKRFVEEVRPLTEALERWHEYLAGPYLDENKYRAYAGKLYVRNAVEMTFCIDDVRKGELPRKLAAFLLQGREAEFIYTLTLASDNYDFEVLTLQHDGFVSRGEVPEEAVAEAREATGMDYAQFLIKPFSDSKTPILTR